MIKEFCAENVTKLEWAIERGIDRVELCDNLAAGGTTPSVGVIRQAVSICEKNEIELAVIIRPRGGDFNYTKEELDIMRYDIERAVDVGVKQIVIGCLTEETKIDIEAMKFLLDGFGDLTVTFHMAFDAIDPKYKLESLDQLIELGVKRILLHGTDKDKSVVENADELNSYIDYVDNKIELMAGGGITTDNLADADQAINTSIFHGTKIVG